VTKPVKRVLWDVSGERQGSKQSAVFLIVTNLQTNRRALPFTQFRKDVFGRFFTAKKGVFLFGQRLQRTLFSRYFLFKKQRVPVKYIKKAKRIMTVPNFPLFSLRWNR
jgi:hypothetical protein